MSKTEIERDPTCGLNAQYALEPGEYNGGGPVKHNAEDGPESGPQTGAVSRKTQGFGGFRIDHALRLLAFLFENHIGDF